MEKKVYIEGMSCANCAGHVEKALKALCGVNKVVVDLDGKFAILTLAHSIEDEQIKTAVKDVGYSVTRVD